MGLKDRTKFFSGIQTAPTQADLQVPNTVSRHIRPGDRALTGVVSEAGKPVLDSELNLHQDSIFLENYLLRQWHTPSGWLRGRTHLDGYCDYFTGTAAPELTDPSGDPEDLVVDADGTFINSFALPRLVAHVAGRPVVVEYTNTGVAGWNIVSLAEPTLYDGTEATVKRTDFVFLEVWQALVAPSPRAGGFVRVSANADLTAGDVVTINGSALTAVAGAPGVDEFQIGADGEATAVNIAAAFNAPANSFDTVVNARPYANTVVLKAEDPGTAGNLTTLSITVANAGALTVSGATLTGGESRPNKPTDQSKLYRHGNVLSPSTVWLDDDLTDPTLGTETSQRIQLQYRIRSSGVAEQVNYKTHPDGFSSLRAGGGPNDASVFAQGNRSAPVWSGNGIDTLSYPFVRADGSHTWLDSDAGEFGVVDDGLWVAGDGSEAAAQALGAVDGFVYAIPICFVHRHNNSSDVLVASKGFDPSNNANGAPTYAHGGYNGVLGAIPAGESDRPDGHFADVITQENLLDLRRHVMPQGIDMAAELQYQMQSLLDGTLRTWSVDTADKQDLGGNSGDVSTRFLVCNEIGRLPAEGGNAPFSGDTGRGVNIRNFDHVARRFADQPICERLVVAFYPGDRPDLVTQGGPVAPGLENPGKYVIKHEDVPGTPVDTGWYENDVLVFDLTNFDASTLGGIYQGLSGDGLSAVGLPSSTFSTFAPSGTVITDILGMWHDDGHYTTAVDQSVQAKTIVGLGTQKVDITLDCNGLTVNGGNSGNADQVMVGCDLIITLPAGTDFTFADTNPDTITRNDGGSFIDDGFVDGMSIEISGAANPLNNGTYVIAVGGVAAGTLTLSAADALTADLNDITAVIATSNPSVPTLAKHLGSRRRIFVEFEVTYPLGAGLTDTPDHEVTPSAVVYNGGGQGPGPVIEAAVGQRPADFEALLAPRFRSGYRETQVEYVANDANLHAVGAAGVPVGGVMVEQLVSRNRTDLYFPRRVFGTALGPMANTTSVTDAVAAGAQAVDEAQTEFGSSSRLVKLDSNLSGTGQTLCDIRYFAQDAIPNYGASGAGYQIGVYFRSNSPQTAGVKEGDIGSTGDGTLPTTLNVEPLLMSTNVWTGQVGVGAHHNGYPYAVPLDQIPVNDGTAFNPVSGSGGSVKEWFFAASAMVSIDDFNADTGLLALRPFVQGDVQNGQSFGGLGNNERPRKDAEFRAFYPYADINTYRPTVLSQPLHGATRHKVMAPMLVRAVEDITGVAGGILFRKSELLLVVLTRFAELDDENNVRFFDDSATNRTSAAVYRTRNLLLTVGDRTCP